MADVHGMRGVAFKEAFACASMLYIMFHYVHSCKGNAVYEQGQNETLKVGVERCKLRVCVSS